MIIYQELHELAIRAANTWSNLQTEGDMKNAFAQHLTESSHIFDHNSSVHFLHRCIKSHVLYKFEEIEIHRHLADNRFLLVNVLQFENLHGIMARVHTRIASFLKFYTDANQLYACIIITSTVSFLFLFLIFIHTDDTIYNGGETRLLISNKSYVLVEFFSYHYGFN